jgi:imidazolonepropionase-like amidohydrolase
MKTALTVALTALVLTGALLAFRGSAAQSGAPLAFTNVSVVPMDSRRILADHTVIVANGRVSAVGPAAATAVPEGAVRVDGRGKYLMPGLAEMHGHIPPPTTAKEFIDDALFLYVANGVTTVRGMQGAPGQLELREAAKRGDGIAPNLYLAGPAFNGNSVRTPDDAAARVLENCATCLVRQQWTTSLEKRLKDPEFNPIEAKQYIDKRMRTLRALHATGVGILLGSDAPQQFNVPGFSIHHGMKRMTDAGMTPYDIIRAGTSTVGQHFRAQDDFGTVAVGHRADLILLDANPLEDLAHIQRQAGVMLRSCRNPRVE